MNDMTFVLGLFALITLIAVVIIWQVFSVARAKASAAREQAYQQLAARATETQERIANDLGRATEDLGELRQRVATIEKLLREVG